MSEQTQLEKDLATEMSELSEPTAPNADELSDKIAEENAGDTKETDTPVDEVSTKIEEKETEPVKTDDAPRDNPDKGDDGKDSPVPPETAAEEPKLILGRFKSHEELEKAYENLHKEFTKKSQVLAETAKTMVDPDEFDIKVNEAAGNAMVPVVEKALNAITNPEHLKEALFEWQQYKNTGDTAHFEKARGFLTAAADRNLEVNLMNTKAEVIQQFNSKRDEIELAPVAQSLKELEEADPEWMKEESHQNILIEAIKLNRKVDIKSVKAMIDEISKKAVEKYKQAEHKKAALAEEKKGDVSVKASDRIDPPELPKDWRKMSIEEQLNEEYKK